MNAIRYRLRPYLRINPFPGPRQRCLLNCDLISGVTTEMRANIRRRYCFFVSLDADLDDDGYGAVGSLLRLSDTLHLCRMARRRLLFLDVRLIVRLLAAADIRRGGIIRTTYLW